MRTLYGKGVWACHEKDVSRAIDVAQAIGARVVILRTSHEGTYFEPAARRAVRHILDAGLVPCASLLVACRDPDTEVQVATQTVLDGYAGLVFECRESASGQYEGAIRLGEWMIETELPPEVMFFTSFPNISAHLDLPYAELSYFCRGGFMPQAFASLGWNPVYTLDVLAYREFRLWSEAHDIVMPIYPVLGLFSGTQEGQKPLTMGEMRPWCRVLSRHKPTFFSVYHAAIIPETVWPLLATIETTPRGQQLPREPVVGEYVTVHPGETVSRICAEYGCSDEQFWAWNAHLWDAQSQPHDPTLLRQGWIVRIR